MLNTRPASKTLPQDSSFKMWEVASTTHSKVASKLNVKQNWSFTFFFVETFPELGLFFFLFTLGISKTPFPVGLVKLEVLLKNILSLRRGKKSSLPLAGHITPCFVLPDLSGDLSRLSVSSDRLFFVHSSDVFEQCSANAVNISKLEEVSFSELGELLKVNYKNWNVIVKKWCHDHKYVQGKFNWMWEGREKL